MSWDASQKKLAVFREANQSEDRDTSEVRVRARAVGVLIAVGSTSSSR